MKLGDCLGPAQLEHSHIQRLRAEKIMNVPMGQTGHDLVFDVFLYILPFFSFGWRTCGKLLAEIAWFDIGDDAAVLNSVEVVNDWDMMSERMLGSGKRKDLLSSTAEWAAFRNSSEFMLTQ